MSRSRHNSPFIGHTTAETDKLWKAQSARRTRRQARQTLAETLDGDALPRRKWAITTPWDGPKDGKQRIDPDLRSMRNSPSFTPPRAPGRSRR